MNSIRPVFFCVWQAIACQGEQGGFEGCYRKSLSIRSLGCRSANAAAGGKSICLNCTIMINHLHFGYVYGNVQCAGGPCGVRGGDCI